MKCVDDKTDGRGKSDKPDITYEAIITNKNFSTVSKMTVYIIANGDTDKVKKFIAEESGDVIYVMLVDEDLMRDYPAIKDKNGIVYFVNQHHRSFKIYDHFNDYIKSKK